ncbi:MAG: helix-turn-helix domain-containing protein [Planctomycetes bacterium]|nr:helix-turn-helix domain-containing protein [Planctomycetota bacterium]
MSDFGLVISGLSDKDCQRIFHAFRWPNGIRCIKCHRVQNKIYTSSKNFRYHCDKCNIWWSDFTGTVLQDSRLSLSQWLAAIYYFLELHLTATEAAHKLNLHRNTAQHLHKKINKEPLWCRLLLDKISGQQNKDLVYLMSLKEVIGYLGLSRRTIYRLIAAGSLSASKIGGQWRFRPEDLQKYFTSRLNRYGTIATEESISFRPEVLDKYRKDKTKYYIQEEAYQGWVGSKEDYNYMQGLLTLLGKGVRHTAPLGRIAFYDVHFRKVVTKDGHPAVSISQLDYGELPAGEYEYWSRFRI